MDIRLNFINRSNDQSNSDVLVFQKNPATGFEELAIAWLVIRNCGRGDNHPFVYPQAMAVGCSDAWGNYTPRLVAQNGQLFHMIKNASGDVLQLAGDGNDPRAIQVRNDLSAGAIDVTIYKADRPLAATTGVMPAMTVSFQFEPTIYIGVASQIEQGQVINSAIMSTINTEISLLGIASADIVMTGGGPGPKSTPFVFTLENVGYA
jgi:hypothetical protein